MQRFVRNDGEDQGASASLPQQSNSDTADGNSLTRLLEEVAKKVSFSEDAAFYVAGPSGKILFVSAGYHCLMGLVPESGQIANDIFQFIFNNRESYVRDEVVNTAFPEAPARFVRSFHYPMNDRAGNLLGIVGHYVDATGQVAAIRQASQEVNRKQDQLRASSDLFWELDAQGHLVLLSERASDILGKPASLFHGRELTEIGRFVDRLGAETSPPDNYFRRQPYRNAIFLMTAQDRKPQYFHMSAVPVFDPASGKFQGYRGVGVNVTERFQAEDAAAAALRELELVKETLLHRNIQLDIERARAEKALRVKTDFLATMSHELRTPLNAILGFSEAMTMKLFGELSEQYADYSEDILKSGQHLLSLIDTMLESARVEGSEVSVNAQAVDVSSLAQQAIAIVQLRAAAKNLDITRTAVYPGWVVKADPLLTTQILVNLLSNAVKFTNPNGAIGIEVAADVENGVAVAAITVWDTGIGISPEMQTRVFDKFVRGDNAFKYDDIGQGIGLGLHISKRLAELMMGSLRLQSVHGKGSRLTISLPLVSTP